jgi:hypothetical protein
MLSKSQDLVQPEGLGKLIKFNYLIRSQAHNLHTKFMVGDCNDNVGRADIIKMTIRNKCLHKIIIDNSVSVVNFAISKNLQYDVPTSQHP